MTDLWWECWALPVGFALDAALGDPRGWPHPVRWVGRLTGTTEQVVRASLAIPGVSRLQWLEYPAGIVLLAVVAGVTGLTAWGVESAAARAGWMALFLSNSLMIYFGLAMKSLGDESLRAAEEPDLDRARAEVSMIVGRDTDALDLPEICRACIETVAENCNDAVVAPLFWFAVGGPVGLWVYKAINTLDSMVGYRNERYRRGSASESDS